MSSDPRYLEGTTIGSGRDIVGVRRDRINQIIYVGKRLVQRGKRDKVLPETITGATAALLVAIAGYGEPITEGQWKELAGLVGGIMRDPTFGDLSRLRGIIPNEQFYNMVRNTGYNRFIRRLEDGRWICEYSDDTDEDNGEA